MWSLSTVNNKDNRTSLLLFCYSAVLLLWISIISIWKSKYRLGMSLQDISPKNSRFELSDLKRVYATSLKWIITKYYNKALRKNTTQRSSEANEIQTLHPKLHYWKNYSTYILPDIHTVKTSEMRLLVKKKVNSFQPLTIFGQSSILEVWLDSE